MTMIMSRAVFFGKMGESECSMQTMYYHFLKNTLPTTEKNWKLSTAI